MGSHRGEDLVVPVQELLVDVVNALHDRFYEGEFGGDVAELGLALTEDLTDDAEILSGCGVVGVVVL